MQRLRTFPSFLVGAFAVNSSLVAVTTVFSIIFVLNGTCDGNGISAINSLLLLIITVILAVVAVFYAFIKRKQPNKCIQWLFLCILWGIQYGLITYSWSIYCTSTALDIFYFIWVVVYNIMIICCIIGISTGYQDKFGFTALILFYIVISTILELFYVNHAVARDDSFWSVFIAIAFAICLIISCVVASFSFFYSNDSDDEDVGFWFVYIMQYLFVWWAFWRWYDEETKSGFWWIFLILIVIHSIAIITVLTLIVRARSC